VVDDADARMSYDSPGGCFPANNGTSPYWLLSWSHSDAKTPQKSHRGEAETIAQAVREKYDVVLTDDKEAAERATEYGLRVISTPELLRIIAATGVVPATD